MKRIVLYIICFFSLNGAISQSSIVFLSDFDFTKETFRTPPKAGTGFSFLYNKQLFLKENFTIKAGYNNFFTITALNYDAVNFYYCRVGYSKNLFKDNLGLFADIGIGLLDFVTYNHSNISFSFGASHQFKLKKNKFLYTAISYTSVKNAEFVPADYYAWYGLHLGYGIFFKRRSISKHPSLE